MNINKRLKITLLASILLLLMTGCQQQSDQEKQPPQQHENATQRNQPPNEAALDYEPEQKSKREIDQIENPRSSGPSGREEQQPEGGGASNKAEQALRGTPESEQGEKEKLSPSERMEKQQPSFTQLDTDQDGYISKEEAQASDALALHFDQLDQNKDGKLDATEFD